MLAHSPQFDRPVHCANHVVGDDRVWHHLRVDLLKDIFLERDILRFRELTRRILPEPSEDGLDFLPAEQDGFFFRDAELFTVEIVDVVEGDVGSVDLEQARGGAAGDDCGQMETEISPSALLLAVERTARVRESEFVVNKIAK